MNATIDFIRRYIAENGRPPSMMDFVHEGLASSPSHASYITDRLVDAGKIEKKPRIYRGIVLLEDK